MGGSSPEGGSAKRKGQAPQDRADRLAGEAHDTLVNVHQVLAEFVPENAAASPLIPIHPGARKYYKEVGAIK